MRVIIKPRHCSVGFTVVASLTEAKRLLREYGEGSALEITKEGITICYAVKNGKIIIAGKWPVGF